LHHTGSQTVTPVAVHEEPEEQPEVRQQEVPEADEEVGEDLLECPDHRPSSFERGKPRSISLYHILVTLVFAVKKCLA
jgi:hypothetical protein